MLTTSKTKMGQVTAAAAVPIVRQALAEPDPWPGQGKEKIIHEGLHSDMAASNIMAKTSEYTYTAHIIWVSLKMGYIPNEIAI